jgi:hypothetical protein
MALALVGCSNKADRYSPTNYGQDKSGVTEMDANLWAMIRYLAKAPEGLTTPERFYAAYDSHYLEQKKLHLIEAWYKDGEANYFLISKPAPSLTEKRTATGGKVVFDDNGKIKEYEEVFRTWKMVPDTLKKRSMILFDKMVKGEPLKPFETKYSNGVEYIEFPDETTYYDKVGREWRVRGE